MAELTEQEQEEARAELIADIVSGLATKIKDSSPKENCVELFGVKVISQTESLSEVSKTLQKIINKNKVLIGQKMKDSKLNGKDFYG